MDFFHSKSFHDRIWVIENRSSEKDPDVGNEIAVLFVEAFC